MVSSETKSRPRGEVTEFNGLFRVLREQGLSEAFLTRGTEGSTDYMVRWRRVISSAEAIPEARKRIVSELSDGELAVYLTVTHQHETAGKSRHVTDTTFPVPAARVRS